MRKLFASTLTSVAFLAGIVAAYSWIIFVIKFLVDVLHYDLGFWSSLFGNILTFMIVEIIAVIVLAITGGLAVKLFNVKTKRGR